MRCNINRHSLQYLDFIWPVVTQQWSFPPILSPWNARFSLLLVPGKYSYALRQQPSWCVPPYFQQIVYASPLRTCEDLSETERGPFMWQCRSGINDTDNSRGCLDVKFSSKPHITSDVDKKNFTGMLGCWIQQQATHNIKAGLLTVHRDASRVLLPTGPPTGDVWCPPPVWNLRAVIWFPFPISSLVFSA